MNQAPQVHKTNLHMGKPLRQWQKECTDLKSRFTVLVLHRRAGKTELALLKLIDCWVNTTKDDALYAYVSPQLSQSVRNVWNRLKTLIRPLSANKMISVNEQAHTITLLVNPHKPMLQLFGAENAEAIRGIHFDGVVVDEVANIKRETWEQIIYPTLIDKGRQGWGMFIGTPNGHNLFYELWVRSQDPKKADWQGKKYTVYQTDAIEPQDIEDARNSMSPQAFEKEFLCNFDVEADDQLISAIETNESLKRNYSDREMLDYPLILGVDVARFGSDSTVLYPRRGLHAYKPIVLKGYDNMATASRIANFINVEECEYVFIDGGQGGGVIDRLHQLGFMQVIEVPFGSRAINDKLYKNRRAEMWHHVKEWIRSGGWIEDSATCDELTYPTYKYDPAGRMVLESKEDIKKRLGHSPDLADALCLSLAEPVGFSSKTGAYKQNNTDYDPLAHYEEECERLAV